ncbi:hypothetical protein EJB05_14501, partial [Eragrostis curvula]
MWQCSRPPTAIHALLSVSARPEPPPPLRATPQARGRGADEWARPAPSRRRPPSHRSCTGALTRGRGVARDPGPRESGPDGWTRAPPSPALLVYSAASAHGPRHQFLSRRPPSCLRWVGQPLPSRRRHFREHLERVAATWPRRRRRPRPARRLVSFRCRAPCFCGGGCCWWSWRWRRCLAAAVDAQQQRLASRTDVAGLYSLRASLALRARDWPLKSDPCTAWTGVGCRAGRVVALTVAGLRRTRQGALAPRLALDGLRNLTALESFNASGFALPGEIPAWFGTGLPPPLAVLDLTSAGVNGTLPADLGASGNLTTLLLAGNGLTGPVPAPLLSVKGIRFLDLSRNNFSGELPNVSAVAAGDVVAASLFNVSGNSLYGVAGDAVRLLRRRFQVVDVSSNYLDGAWNGSDGTVLVTMNCFYGVPGQRSRADCEEFYRKQGVGLVDAPAPSPLPSPQPSPLPLPQPLPEKGKKQGISKPLLIGVLVAAGTLMVLFLVALLLCFMGKRERRNGRGVEPNEEGTRSGRRRDSSVNPVASSPSAMSPRAIAGPKDVSSISVGHATGGFGDDNLLNHGHSGDIYHGILENGSHVIVKKVGAKSVSKHASELDFYKRYTHERIVPLIGHFSKDDDEFLAYKYMPKGDLTNALHKKPVDTADGLPSLDWITRLKIATGVAEAMCFLHDECSPPLVHRSLDKHTSGPPATCSYDVHCFGKVLLELVTGNFGISGPTAAASEESDWLTNTLNHINSGDKSSITGIIDPLLLVDEDHLEEVWAVAIIAKTCLNAKPSRRPSARYVLRALENPLRVVRASASARQLRSSSSRSSWQSVFQGNGGGGGRVQSLDVAASGRALDRRHSARSYGSGGGGGASFSFRRAAHTPEIVPEPAVAREDEENGVVV